jgi:hypothetical protein
MPKEAVPPRGMVISGPLPPRTYLRQENLPQGLGTAHGMPVE